MRVNTNYKFDPIDKEMLLGQFQTSANRERESLHSDSSYVDSSGSIHKHNFGPMTFTLGSGNSYDNISPLRPTNLTPMTK